MEPDKRPPARDELTFALRFAVANVGAGQDAYGFERDEETIVQEALREILKGDWLILDGKVYRVVKGIAAPDPEVPETMMAAIGEAYL